MILTWFLETLSGKSYIYTGQQNTLHAEVTKYAPVRVAHTHIEFTNLWFSGAVFRKNLRF